MGVLRIWLLFVSSIFEFSSKDCVADEFDGVCERDFFICKFNVYGFVLLIKLRGNCIFVSSLIFDDDGVVDTSTILDNDELLLTVTVVGTDDDDNNWSVEQFWISIDGGSGSGVVNDWESTWIVGDCVSEYKNNNQLISVGLISDK